MIYKLLPFAWVKETTEAFGLISAIFGGTIALVALTRKVVKSARKASDAHSRLMQITEVMTPEVLANLTTIATQLRPNGGSSLMDKVTRIEAAIYRGDAMRQIELNATGLAFWEADAAGQTTYASDAALALMGVPVNQVRGNGWVTNVEEADRSRVYAEWLAAVQQQRAYASHHVYVHANGDRRDVHVHATPILDSAGRTLGFVGVMTPLST